MRLSMNCVTPMINSLCSNLSYPFMLLLGFPNIASAKTVLVSSIDISFYSSMCASTSALLIILFLPVCKKSNNF